MNLTVLVCGGRDYRDYDSLKSFLDNLRWMTTAAGNKIGLLVHGGATGADALANIWAFENGVPVKRFPAEWDKHGRSAGPIRNRKMFEESAPDVVVAFPGGKGTADMVNVAEKHNSTSDRKVSILYAYDRTKPQG